MIDIILSWDITSIESDDTTIGGAGNWNDYIDGGGADNVIGFLVSGDDSTTTWTLQSVLWQVLVVVSGKQRGRWYFKCYVFLGERGVEPQRLVRPCLQAKALA